ncbi:MAG: GNAT family N-acetyltransferase [Ramlibacter sp.]|nr:GNAT family N-acetyltransferase [Ramlibacter sp.]
MPQTRLPSLSAPPAAGGAAAYRTRLAQGRDDVRAAQALRFRVFNLELREGLDQSWETCSDADRFDAVCDHLLVEDRHTGQLVGTYRLQTGTRAAAHHGYYCEREFNFAPFEPLRGELLELGRACLLEGHRNYPALSALWKGIAHYAQSHGQRYLIGCSSLTSQDPAVGAAAWQQLQRHAAPAALCTLPHADWACPTQNAAQGPVAIPKLLAAYLALGGQVCGPPALDREFKTIDFLTLLDLQPASPWAAQRLARFGVTRDRGR